MLLRFTAQNFRSIRDPMDVSWVGSSLSDAPAHRFDYRDAQVEHGVLPVVAVFGANASGKSNVLSALAHMAREVTASHTSRNPGALIPFQSFALDPAFVGRPSVLSADFVVDSARYQYGFSHDSQQFLSEWLHAFSGGRKQVWFERRAEEPIYFGPNLKGKKKLIGELTRPNSLFLSAAAQQNHAQLTDIYRWFSGVQSSHRRAASGPLSSRSYLFRSEHRERITGLLRAADLGIEGFRRVPNENLVELAHSGITGPVFLPPQAESHGTKMLLSHIEDILAVLQSGGLWVVDELDASLHSKLSAAIVGLFTSSVANPKGAQLFLSTHDESLLNVLRRDEVLFVEKGSDGASGLVPLTEFNTRKRDDLQKAYDEGRFGAVPLVGDFAEILGQEQVTRNI